MIVLHDADEAESSREPSVVAIGVFDGLHLGHQRVIATLISTYRPEQLKGHLARALDNGVTKDEIAEVITHLAFYAGWPASMTAARVAKEVYEERGLM